MPAISNDSDVVTKGTTRSSACRRLPYIGQSPRGGIGCPGSCAGSAHTPTILYSRYFNTRLSTCFVFVSRKIPNPSDFKLGHYRRFGLTPASRHGNQASDFDAKFTQQSRRGS
jgi:hypothetical protein